MAHFTTNPVTGSSPRAGFVVYRTGEAGESTPGGGSQDAPRDHEHRHALESRALQGVSNIFFWSVRR